MITFKEYLLKSIRSISVFGWILIFFLLNLGFFLFGAMVALNYNFDSYALNIVDLLVVYLISFSSGIVLVLGMWYVAYVVFTNHEILKK